MVAAPAHSRFRLALEEGLRVVKEWKDPQPEAEEPHWGIVFNKVTHGALEKNGDRYFPVGMFQGRGGETPALRWVIDMSFILLHEYNRKKRRLGR